MKLRYKNKTCNYINGSFIYIIKACIYSFLIMQRSLGPIQRKFIPYRKEVFL